MAEDFPLIRFGIKQFKADKILSYLFFDRDEKLAIVINPHFSLMGDYRSYLALNCLALTRAITTVSDSVHEESLRLFPENIRVESPLGDHLSVGSFNLAALHSDGHFVGLHGEQVLFLSDLNWVQSSLSLGFFEGLKKLRPSTVLYPAYERSGAVFSVLEIELSPVIPGRLNTRVIEMGIEKYKSKLAEGAPHCLFIDVRDPAEFELGHIPGVQNFPFSEVGLHWSDLKKRKKIYVSCSGGERSIQIVRTLNSLGFTDVIHFKAGFRGWQNAGLPIAT